MTNLQRAVLLCLSIQPSLGCAPQTSRSNVSLEAPTRSLHVIPIEQARWQATSFSGVEAAVLWGDPERDAQGAELLKIRAGIAFPRHTHTYDERVLVISGTFVLILSEGAEQELHPGSYYYLPADLLHSSRCDAGESCLVQSEVIPRTKAKT